MKKSLIILYRDSLFRNSLYLMLATALVAGFGFFFWLINARLFSIEQIGLATALISVMNLIALLSLIGFNVAFVRFLPSALNKNDQINTGINLVSLVSISIAVLFIAFVSVISPQLAFIKSPWFALIFVIACLMNAVNVLTDSVFLAERQTKFTLIIDAIYSLLKMLAPFAFIGWGAMGIFIAAALAQTLGCALSIAALIRYFNFKPKFILNAPFIKNVWAFCAVNYLSLLLALIPSTLLPLIIINHLGAKSAAYFYIAMMIGNLLYTIPSATTRSLLAEGSHMETSFTTQIKKSVFLITALLLPAIAIIVIGAGEILSIFGKAYGQEGAIFLRLIAITGIAFSASSILGSLFLVTKNKVAIISTNVGYAIFTIILTYALLPLGLTGVGIAWLVGNSITGVIGYIFYRTPEHPIQKIKTAYFDLYYVFKIWLVCKKAYFRTVFKNGARATVLFYPDRPNPEHLLYQLCHKLGVKIVTNPKKTFGFVFFFCDTTYPLEDTTLKELKKNYVVINGNCSDISKQRVGDIFNEVFEYNTSIDPCIATTPFVRKSNINAQHDGVVLHTPCEPEEGYVYQKLINNTVEDGRVMDIRVFIFKNDIPFVFYRYRSIDDRFDQTELAERIDTNDALSQSEQKQIIEFCRSFGLDYGELDVLRDKDDGKIYIVDVNNTPYGPHPGVQISHEGYARFISDLTGSFARSFL